MCCCCLCAPSEFVSVFISSLFVRCRVFVCNWLSNWFTCFLCLEKTCCQTLLHAFCRVYVCWILSACCMCFLYLQVLSAFANVVLIWQCWASFWSLCFKSSKIYTICQDNEPPTPLMASSVSVAPYLTALEGTNSLLHLLCYIAASLSYSKGLGFCITGVNIVDVMSERSQQAAGTK